MIRSSGRSSGARSATRLCASHPAATDRDQNARSGSRRYGWSSDDVISADLFDDPPQHHLAVKTVSVGDVIMPILRLQKAVFVLDLAGHRNELAAHLARRFGQHLLKQKPKFQSDIGRRDFHVFEFLPFELRPFYENGLTYQYLSERLVILF